MHVIRQTWLSCISTNSFLYSTCYMLAFTNVKNQNTVAGMYTVFCVEKRWYVTTAVKSQYMPQTLSRVRQVESGYVRLVAGMYAGCSVVTVTNTVSVKSQAFVLDHGMHGKFSNKLSPRFVNWGAMSCVACPFPSSPTARKFQIHEDFPHNQSCAFTKMATRTGVSVIYCF